MDPAYARVIPDVPFHDLPGYLCTGDLVCLLQDPSNLTARFQMPAKLTDALAMGIPVLASNAPPLANVAREGLVELPGSTPLATKIEEIFVNYPAYQEQARTNRNRFLSQYSYASRRSWMKAMLNRLLETPPSPLPAEFKNLIDNHRRLFPQPQIFQSLLDAGPRVYCLPNHSVPTISQPVRLSLHTSAKAETLWTTRSISSSFGSRTTQEYTAADRTCS